MTRKYDKKKVLNHVVKFYGVLGKELLMRFSDSELYHLRSSSIRVNSTKEHTLSHGRIYNFAIYALFDYVFKSSSKRQRFCATFPYHDFHDILWTLEDK